MVHVLGHLAARKGSTSLVAVVVGLGTSAIPRCDFARYDSSLVLGHFLDAGILPRLLETLSEAFVSIPLHVFSLVEEPVTR